MKQYVAVGIAVVAGAALIEAALIPGLLIGGAAVLAPNLLPKALPSLLRRRKARPAASRRSNAPAASQALVKSQTSPLPRFAVGQAIAKTVTYRVIVTTLDFTTNYIVIGELATAAGLSTFNLVAGPLFYFAHEAAWNYVGHPDSSVELPLVTPSEDNAEKVVVGSITLSRALAKTITFRTLATIMDFTTNYVVIGNVGQAVILSASGFVLGPFVYYGHEKAWDYFSERGAQAGGVSGDTKLLPAPA
jgi:uncharacterized membrane protein